MKIILESIFGSHLYGLNTENSDTDFKGIILPSKEQILLGNTSFHIDQSSNKNNQKNSKNDIDKTYYSLQYFLNLAINGETVCIDLLHGSKNNWNISSDIWDYIIQNRSKFYTKNMKSYIGYVKKQAAKYGIKGSKINELETMITFLEPYKNDVVGNVKFYDTDFGKWINHKNNKFYDFLGSKFQDNLKVYYMIDTLSKIYEKYGERSKLAKENNGIDWKALSHAIRAGLQVKEIFVNGGFEYPLKESEFLLDIKLGKLDFLNEVEPFLENLVNEVYALSEQSSYPEKVDESFWNDFIKTIHLNIITGKI